MARQQRAKETGYLVQKTHGSYCPCGAKVYLLMPPMTKAEDFDKPCFFICFECRRICVPGKGQVGGYEGLKSKRNKQRNEIGPEHG